MKKPLLAHAFLIVAVALVTEVAIAQLPRTPKLGKPVDQPLPSGNFINVITVRKDTALVAASRRLNISADQASSWRVFSQDDGIFKGSIQSIATGRHGLYVTTIYDSNLAVEPTYGPGGGISFSPNFGSSWNHIPQPTDFSTRKGWIRRFNSRGGLDSFLVDVQPIVRKTAFVDTIFSVAVRTNIDNVSFDLAVNDSAIWLACFGGGLRHASVAVDGTIGPFEQATLPPDTLSEVRADAAYDFIIDPIANLNYRVFSVISARDGIWSGSAAGINFSPDGGVSWKRYSSENDGLSGNFVVAIGEQIYSEDGATYRNIWAATNRAVNASEFHGLSVTSDSGATWRTVLRGPFVNNLAFDGKTVWVATEDGLYRSDDLGLTWTNRQIIVDVATGDRTFDPEFTSVGVDRINGIIYAGTGDGLCISKDGGITWNILRAYRPPGTGGIPKSYAYPNPFSPSIEPNVVRFQFDKTGMDESGDVATIKIYDFAMDLVATVAEKRPVSETFFWTGLNNKGNRVANGTYVYVIQAGGKKFWGKVTVRN